MSSRWLCSAALTIGAITIAVSTQAENLALGRSYTLVPAPSYQLCTDEGDVTQLTDGAFVGPEQFWIQEGCVGWKLPVDGDADVIIDLGQVRAIDAIRFRTAASPNADVYLPTARFAVSDDGQRFHVVAGVGMVDDPQLSRRWMEATDLRTRGRYVLVRLHAEGVFAFTDEVEVLSGEHDPATVTLPEQTIAPLVPEIVRTPLQMRLLRDLEGLRAVLARIGDPAGLAPRIDEAQAAVEALEETAGEAASGAEAAVAAIHADTVRALRGDRQMVAWVADPYAPASPRDLPPERPEDAVRVTLAQNAHASAAVTVANLTDAAVEVPVALEGLDGLVRLREARFIATRQGNLLADALPLLDDGAITLPPREARQVWVDIASGETAPGEQSGALTVGDARIAVAITVASVRIPDDLPYSSYSWQYLDTWPALQGIEDAAIADLRAHHTNVNILTSTSVPWPTEVDEQGNMTAPLEFETHDRMVELCAPISDHGIAFFAGFSHGRRGFDQFERFSEPWRRLYRQWLTAWVAHLQQIGVGYDRFILYPLDETIDEVYAEIATLTRDVDPRVRLFADPLARDSDERLRAVLDLVDIWCPNLSMYERRPWQLEMMRETGATIWSYTVGRRESDPYAHYRLHHWRAWRDGAEGAGFWAYAQGGDWQDTDLWDDFSVPNSDYGVIYTLTGAPEDVSRAEAIIPGKRWEAWREGIEEWVCLWMLEQAVAGRDDAAQQREWIALTWADVLGDPADTSRAARARAEVLARLAAIQGQ